MRNVLFGIIAALVIVLIIVAYYAFAPAIARVDARVQGDIEQEYIIQDARTRISAYEWFYDQYEQIQATELKARIAKGAEEEAGIRMVLASMIAEYNAMARKAHTRAQWMPTDLPYQIEMEVEI